MLASHGFVSCFSLHQRARLCLALDPRRANRAGEMLGRPNQAARVSTLLDAKKRSSFVTWMWSNNHMQRSRASRFFIIISLLYARPADVERWAACLNSVLVNKIGMYE